MEKLPGGSCPEEKVRVSARGLSCKWQLNQARSPPRSGSSNGHLRSEGHPCLWRQCHPVDFFPTQSQNWAWDSAQSELLGGKSRQELEHRAGEGGRQVILDPGPGRMPGPRAFQLIYCAAGDIHGLLLTPADDRRRLK